nr:hypothetical protein [Tanacetum cinerariifolium]
MAFWKSQIEDYTFGCLRVVSISRFFVDDIYRDHVVLCACIVVNKHRHNFMCDTLVDIRFQSEVLTCKEVDIGLGVRQDKPLPLTVMLLYSWDGCLDMVNTRTDAELVEAVQNALQTLLPQIRAEIREEFRTSSGPSDSGGNPPPVTIHTWLERFNKQKPRSFEKATTPVDAENWISHMEKFFDVMGCEDAFKTRLAVYKFEVFPRAEQERLKRKYHSIPAGTVEEQAKNFQWGLCRKGEAVHKTTTIEDKRLQCTLTYVLIVRNSR